MKYFAESYCRTIREVKHRSQYTIRHLKENPEVIKELCSARKAIENISQIQNLTIAGVRRDVFDIAMEFS